MLSFLVACAIDLIADIVDGEDDLLIGVARIPHSSPTTCYADYAANSGLYFAGSSSRPLVF